MLALRVIIIAILSVLASILLVREKYIPKTTDVCNSTYDYVIVGAGTAGCVLANRLSETNCTVLLIEVGDCPFAPTEVPIAAIGVYNSENDWSFLSDELKGDYGCCLKDRQMPLHSGKMLGGHSGLNFMLPHIASPCSYNRWCEEHGAEGWCYEDMIPYFKKAINNTNETLVQKGCSYKGGQITVEDLRYSPDIGKAFIKGNMELGYPYPSCANNTTGVVQMQGTTRNGRRCGTHKAYCVPADCRTNLQIVKRAYVKKIIFNGNVAEGVEFETDKCKNCIAIAKKEVIISAGAINSPKLLQLSGIGDKTHLEQLGIKVIFNNPAVGKNLCDHVGTAGLCFEAPKALPLIPYNLFEPTAAEAYVLYGRGPYTSLNGVEGVAWINTKHNNVSSGDCPDGGIYISGASVCSDFAFYLANITGLSNECYEAICKGYSPLKFTFSFFIFAMNPNSRGEVKIKSADPFDPPSIKAPIPDDHDLEVSVDTLEQCIELVNTTAFKEVEAKLFTTVIPACKNYVLYSRDYLKCLVKCYPLSFYHFSGTCKMGAEDDNRTVVNSKLQVIGVSNLRVVDESVMPSITGCDTYISTVALAEKAADIIKKDSGCN